MATENLSNRRLKEIRSLTRRKYRERLGQTLIEGHRNVEAAVTAGAPIREILVTVEARPGFVDGAGLPVFVVSSAEMDAISDVETSQGILAVVETPVLDARGLGAMERIVALDGVRDPGNAGTLIRTAAWFGAGAVMTAPGTVDVYNPKVMRAAMGGLWDVAHAYVDDLAASLSDLRDHGFALYGADLDGTPIGAWTPRTPSILVLGSEAHGLSEGMPELLDERVVIPGGSGRMATESLNVAVAAGILMYAWVSR